MATATTSRAINLAQLSRETGWGLTLTDDGTTRTVYCPQAGITNAGLQTKVDAHVAIDEDANGTTLRTQAETALANNRAFLAIGSPTNAQTLAQVKALTRQNNGIIRLLLHKLDGTD